MMKTIEVFQFTELKHQEGKNSRLNAFSFSAQISSPTLHHSFEFALVTKLSQFFETVSSTRYESYKSTSEFLEERTEYKQNLVLKLLFFLLKNIYSLNCNSNLKLFRTKTYSELCHNEKYATSNNSHIHLSGRFNMIKQM